MKENILEIVVGAIVIILALSFVFFTVSSTGIQKKGKYINAEFGHIGGLKVGDDVVIAGIKVGEVSSNKLDRQSFLAIVELNLEESISIPDDSIAKISSASLLGGQYVEIIPGASDIMLKDEETISKSPSPSRSPKSIPVAKSALVLIIDFVHVGSLEPSLRNSATVSS